MAYSNISNFMAILLSRKASHHNSQYLSAELFNNSVQNHIII